MKFIVDAQLPRRLSHEIAALGDDAVHTLDLPMGNLTADSTILQIASREGRVIVTKDSDFVDSFFLRGEPAKLLFITTGNISNNDLIHLLRTQSQQVRTMLVQGDFVEISRSALTLHV
jgi:predicted nuclease of predicted toxin-antitoxin system